jgi:hypothetical protein
MMPLGQRTRHPLREQGLRRPQFSVQTYSTKQAHRRASSSCLHQCLRKAQEEAMSLSWYLALILRRHLHPDYHQPRGLQMQTRPDQPEGALPLEEEGAK